MNSLAHLIFEDAIYSLPEKTWVILSQPWKDTSQEDRILLQKILAAVGLSLEAVVIKNQPAFNLAEWLHRPQKVLYFGNAVKGLPQNEVIALEGASVVLSAPLADLNSDAAAKQKLWQALKVLFKGQ